MRGSKNLINLFRSARFRKKNKSTGFPHYRSSIIYWRVWFSVKHFLALI